jgi:2-octaprenyl-6-methoxyphenol hydroxylase
VLVHLANDVPPGVAGNTGEPLGQIVASTDLTAALGKVISAHPGITLLGGAEMRDIDFGPTRARVHLADGTAIDAMLVIGADGRRSAVRRAARINVTEWSYGQAAIVTRIAHELPHHDRAAERFLAGGAFAVLPLPDGPGGEHYSSVVWTETAELVGDLMQLGKDDFNAELNARLGPRLGAARAVGRRWTYPLALTLAENYIGHRLALIGDAAHAIHPIAGQGLNLGIRDVAALAEVIVDAYRLGLDFGMKTALVDYQRWRRFDNTMLAAATDLLDRLFRSRLAPLRVARQIGMALFARSAPARRAFLGETMGLAGDLPRLSRGERL